MKKQTISKSVEKFGWKFSFEYEWPESEAETLTAWTQTRVVNHAQNNVVIALRARAESIVKREVRKALGLSNKDASDAAYRATPPATLELAIAVMQAEMPTVAVPSGERVVLNPVERGVRATKDLTDDQIGEILKARGLSIRKGK